MVDLSFATALWAARRCWDSLFCDGYVYSLPPSSRERGSQSHSGLNGSGRGTPGYSTRTVHKSPGGDETPPRKLNKRAEAVAHSLAHEDKQAGKITELMEDITQLLRKLRMKE